MAANSAQPDREDQWTGKILVGDYAIVALIGKGAMAKVYKAKQMSTGRYLALKTLTATEEELVARFAKEVQVHSKLKHKNIAESYGCINDSATGQAFFVMELLEGKTLQERIRSQGPESSAQIVMDIGGQLCDALSYAHRMEIIHRDLKPANVVLLENSGNIVVKVVDFGIAKARNETVQLTMPGQVVGSPIYMSPEQCRGLELDPRADVYSLGCLLYEMITGHVPYYSKNVMQIMNSHCKPEIRPKPIKAFAPNLPGSELLDQVLVKSLQTEREKRFQSVLELKSAIENWHQTVSLGHDDDAHVAVPPRQS